MLALALLSLSALAQPTDATSDCQASAIRSDADGQTSVDPTLLRSCRIAEAIEAPDTRFNPWVPEVEACVPDTSALAWMIADVAHGCRQAALTTDGDGRTRIDPDEVAACMADNGFERARRRRARRWSEGCRSDVVADAR